MTPRNVVVVGASVAGVHTVRTLRRQGYDGRLTLLDAEPELPYDRPPLSKQLLADDLDESDIRLLTDDQLVDFDIEAMLGTPARSLDIGGRRIGTDNGGISFDGLVIATGSVPVRPRGWGSLDGVHVLHSLGDARGLRADLARGRPHVVIVGAGFIGCEIASSARARGLDTTVVEIQPLPLQRALGPALAAPLMRLHQDHGVRMLCDVGVARLLGRNRVEELELTNGTRISADVVVLGVGTAPATDWLVASGLEITDGVATDRMLRTAVPGVYAAGDAARWPHGRSCSLRVELWTNAREQGARAAANLLRPDAAEPYNGVPYRWSEQHGRLLQIAGSTHGGDIRFLRGGPDDGSWLAVLVDEELVVGAVGFDQGVAFRQFRRLIAERISWSALPDHYDSRA
ncbi:NAD(P)/FAD-dependent oxidoreductase [Streptomyces sp. T028]|uniref:NAD(P)/FAD-dependent oxidoreductase n=1 Tax=Streptomyces sp. T028 TaxID=3394379 RepID=UPI003A877F85